MERTPPRPEVKAFLMCRELFQDARTREYILIGPNVNVWSHQFPCLVNQAAYVELTSGHGSYRPSLEIRDVEERVVWSQTFERPLEANDPLRVNVIAVYALTFWVPLPGRYDLVLRLNDEELARRQVWVLHPPPPASPPG